MLQNENDGGNLPTVHNQHTDAGVPSLSPADRAEMDRHFGYDIPPRDDELDRMFAEMMERQDAARETVADAFVSGFRIGGGM